MELLAVVLNYRTPALTLRAVDAAHRALEALPDARLDVVDNDSRDGSLDEIRRGLRARGYPEARVRVLASPWNGGFGAGNNFAIRAALAGSDPPELVYVLNSDAFPAPDAITALVSFLRAHPEVGIAGSAIHGPDGAPHTTAFRFPSVWSELEAGLGLGAASRLLARHRVPISPRPTRTCQVDWLAGASMLIRARVLREIGLFDESFFLYFEETDLCRRARSRGWTTHYVVESRVEHVGGASTGMKHWARVPRYWLDSRHHYFRKTHGAAYAHLASAVFAAAYASYRVRARLQGKRDDASPPFLLRDFVRHAIGAPLPEAGRRTIAGRSGAA